MKERIARYFKKDIPRFEKVTAPFFLVFAVVFIVLGIAMITDGVMSHMSGGYGDNIILGAMVLLFFPVLSVIAFKMISTTSDEWSKQ